ncbi:MAG: STAS domain-containing protein [Bacteroidales bacterium]|nr:STAS domain-containing protein [Bacteroidales bacterium]
METTVSINGTNAVVTLSGRLDTPSAPQVENELKSLTGGEITSAVIDCENLSYISSSGLRILISLHKHFTKTGGSLTVRNLTPAIKEVFDMTGFTNIFNIE